MTFVEKYGPHLPFLRRFARSLTGSQASGDAYVKASLAALTQSELEETQLTPKINLYSHFLKIWESSGLKLDISDPDESMEESKIKKLTPKGRMIFLLRAMEGFSVSEISQMTDNPVEAVEILLSEANLEIENELKTEILIIEDEPIIAADIEDLITEMGHKVLSIAATETEAVIAARGKKPGLVLADVQLADGSSGIDAVDRILTEIDVPVIFITAFPERLLTGEKPEPAFLISKPFDPENVKAAVSQALFFGSSE